MIPESIAILDTVFKDDSPRHTVERIKGILKEYGIETVEKWYESGVPGCYSLRVTVFGTVFGTNGKGVTKDLALASGYGELMERLQIGRVFKSDQQKGGGLYLNSETDQYMPAAELLNRTRDWYVRYAEKASEQTGVEITPEKILEQYTNAEGNVAVTPFYCVTRKTWEYLPTTLLNSVYTANGCAAGNTMEEAVVQAISEIAEREYSIRVLADRIPVPDVPESVLREYKIAYDIITYLRSHNFKVVIKDCSLGTKFPVVCVCLINQQTGKYHTHFGAYPNFEIALQRTLTESFQGNSIENVARFDGFLRKGNGTLHVGNLVNQLVKGVSEKSPEFFVDTAEKYERCTGFTGANNKELLKECIAFISDLGYDILIRNCSCLGFPTYQVIVPGYSEVFAYRMVPECNDLQFHNYSETVLRNPPAASIEQIMGYFMNLQQSAKRQLTVQPFTMQANIPAQLSAAEESYLMSATLAYVNYSLGRHGEALKYVDKMLSFGMEKDAEALVCLKRHLSLRADGYSQDRIRGILEYFHKPETVQTMTTAISEGKNPLDPFVLHCDMKCQPSCVLYGSCVKKQTDALAQIVNKKLREMDSSDWKEQLEQILQ